MIDQLPDSLKNAILDSEKLAVDGLAKILDDNDGDFSDMTPWVYMEEIEKHEIVDLTLESKSAQVL